MFIYFFMYFLLVSGVSLVSFRSFRWFRFARFVWLFWVLVHAQYIRLLSDSIDDLSLLISPAWSSHGFLHSCFSLNIHFLVTYLIVFECYTFFHYHFLKTVTTPKTAFFPTRFFLLHVEFSQRKVGFMISFRYNGRNKPLADRPKVTYNEIYLSWTVHVLVLY